MTTIAANCRQHWCKVI